MTIIKHGSLCFAMWYHTKEMALKVCWTPVLLVSRHLTQGNMEAFTKECVPTTCPLQMMCQVLQGDGTVSCGTISDPAFVN